jgi:hypothetical protein
MSDQGAAECFMGQLLTAHGNRLEGWAWCTSAQARRVQVEIIDGQGNVLTAARASQFGRSLLENGIGDGFHVFRARVPASAFKSPELLARARVKDADHILDGGPLKIFRQGGENAELLDKIRSPEFFERTTLPPFRLTTELGEAEISLAFAEPRQQIDFATRVPGDGWVAAPGGARLDADRRGTIRLSRLHDQPSRMVLSLFGAESAAKSMKVLWDEREIEISIFPVGDVRRWTAYATFPGAGAIRTPVTLSFESESDLVFTSFSLTSSF